MQKIFSIKYRSSNKIINNKIEEESKRLDIIAVNKSEDERNNKMMYKEQEINKLLLGMNKNLQK